jgi:hypothetical protein
MTVAELPSVADADEVTSNEEYYLASGCYRRVYYKPGSKWVYKIGDLTSNKREYETYLKFRPSLTDDIRFPEMHLLKNGVIAAEYIEGNQGDIRCWGYSNNGCSRNCATDCWAKRIHFLSKMIRDLHYGNIRITKDNTIYIIDLGEGENRPCSCGMCN